jgi:Tol biopolymer transport system component
MTRDLYRQPLNRPSESTSLLKAQYPAIPTDWSPDGRFLLYDTIRETGYDTDIFVLPLFGDKKPFPFLQTQFSEGGARFSPDGRRVAYISDESGADEVYVRPFPGPGDRIQVSSGGSASEDEYSPKWRRDGKELFYLSADHKVMAVPLTTGPHFQAGVAHPLFSLEKDSTFEVSPDGQRFLLNIPLETQGRPVEVLTNWNSAIPRQ